MAMLPVTPLKRRACEDPASSCKERRRELPRDNLSGLLNLFRCSRRHQSQLQLVAKEPRILLVVGECGDGKSTLVNALCDPDRSGEAESGLCWLHRRCCGGSSCRIGWSLSRSWPTLKISRLGSDVLKPRSTHEPRLRVDLPTLRTEGQPLDFSASDTLHLLGMVDVIVHAGDVQEILDALQVLPSRGRPRLKPSHPCLTVKAPGDLALFRDAASNCDDGTYLAEILRMEQSNDRLKSLEDGGVDREGGEGSRAARRGRARGGAGRGARTPSRAARSEMTIQAPSGRGLEVSHCRFDRIGCCTDF